MSQEVDNVVDVAFRAAAACAIPALASQHHVLTTVRSVMEITCSQTAVSSNPLTRFVPCFHISRPILVSADGVYVVCSYPIE